MKSVLSRFRSDRSGNFGMMFAIAMVPLLMAGGLAIDMAGISSVKQRLQDSLDAAVLAIVREGDAISDARAREIALTFIDSNFQLAYTDIEIVREGTRVELSAKSRTPLAFGALLGHDDWLVEGSASADIGYNLYEIGLVLDTTGSMAGGKLRSMKDAVNGMVDTMTSQVRDRNRLKFGVVPFSTFVNVGPQFGPTFTNDGRQRTDGARWLDLAGATPVPQFDLQPGVSRFRVANHLGHRWSGCVETRAPSGAAAALQYDTLDTPPDASRPETLFVPAFAPDEPDQFGFDNSYLQNHAEDRDPLDNSIANRKRKLGKYGVPYHGDGTPNPNASWGAPARLSGSSGRGPNRNCDSRPITPLTTDYMLVRREVDALVARGTTNIMEGVAWGWRILSPGEPFAQGRPYGERNLEKIMIVLTDGSNVLGTANNTLGSRYSSFGHLVDGRLGITRGSERDANPIMNAKTLATCDGAKKAGIIIYTIRLEEPDVQTGTMLRECATSEAHFFDAPSRADLDAVFREIGERIVRVRISS